MCNHKHSQGLSSLLFFILLCMASPTWSTSVLQLDLQETVDQADLIVMSHCTKIESVWIDHTLFTRYTMAVDETVNGEEYDAVQVMVPGGIDLNRPVPIAMSVPGAPVFFPNERDVLLLKRISSPRLANMYSIVGFNQGRFRIEGGIVSDQPQAQARSQQKFMSDTSAARLVNKLRLMASKTNPPDSLQKSIYRNLIQEVTP